MTDIKDVAEQCARETGVDLEDAYVGLTNELVETGPGVIACGVLMLGERSNGRKRMVFYFDGCVGSRTFVADEDRIFFEVFEDRNTLH